MASLYIPSALVYHPPSKKKKKKKRMVKLRGARAVVYKIVLALQDEEFRASVGIEATEVFQGGSIGQGTTVPGHYDVDLVLYSRSLSYREAAEDEGYYSGFLNKIDRYLRRTLSFQYTPQGMSDVAVKFTYRDDGKTIDVDLLLSPYWSSPSELLSAMRTVHPPLKRLLFSASTSKFATEFIRNQHAHVKELIRRAKAWRNVVWADNKDGRPKSYLLSLLVITAYERTPGAGIKRRLRTYAHSVTNGLVKLVREIDRSGNLLDLSIPGARKDLRATFADLLPDKPRIVDPVNPSNNIYLSGVGPVTYGPGDGKWDIFVRRVGSIDLSISAQAIMRRVW